jgi:hypothetical protein
MVTTQIPSPSEVAKSPVLFAKHFLRIMDKRDKIVPLAHNSMQSHYLANRTPRDLILKARQIGFSTAIQGEMFRYAVTRPARTLTLANDDDNTQKLRRMANRFYDHLPTDFRPERALANASITTYPVLGSEAMIATAGNKNAGRAGSYRFIHCSEGAFYPDLQSIVASALQAGNPQWVAIESTPNGAQGYFYDLCMEALSGDSNWKLHFYTWFNNTEYQLPLNEGEQFIYSDEESTLIDKHQLTPQQIKWRRVKQKELGRLFAQEYPEDPVSCFLSSGAQVFGEFKVYTPEPDAGPIDGYEYYAGGDWGQEDYSALSIICANTNKEVYLNRWRHMAWADIRREMLDACERWKVLKCRSATQHPVTSKTLAMKPTGAKCKSQSPVSRCRINLRAS